MEERHYRLLLAVVTGLAILNLGAMTAGLFREDAAGGGFSIRFAFRLLGYGLLVIAAAGLWNWNSWAFWLLGLATLTTIGANLADGLQTAFWRIVPHLTMILLTAEQYYTRKEEEEAENANPPPGGL
jgi:hypothetical protein